MASHVVMGFHGVIGFQGEFRGLLRGFHGVDKVGGQSFLCTFTSRTLPPEGECFTCSFRFYSMGVVFLGF